MKSEEQELLEQEYKNSFCNSEGTTIQHLNQFVINTNSSNLPAILKARFTDTANKDIKAITSLMDLQLEQGLEQMKEVPIGEYLTNQETIKQMNEQIKLRERINIKDIENTREKLIELALNKTGTEIKDNKEVVNPLELISF